MKLPAEFVSTIQNTFREDGYTFLKALPDLIAEASARWGLTDVQPAPTLSYNFVAFANRGDNKVVLKMGVPNREIRSEMAALRLFNGEGACKLLDYDEDRCWLLLERLFPGAMLATMEDDDEATRIAAEVMKRIWKTGFDTPSAGASGYSTSASNFIKLTDWFDGLKRLRKIFNGGTGPLNEKLVTRAESSARDFFAENHHPVLMHGDFHHYNILSSERGWLVIDPKGVIGPAGYEVGALLTNPWESLLGRPDLKSLIKKRIEILHEHLGFEHERIREWTLAHAILSAWWGIEDNTGWEYSMEFAGLIAQLK